MDPARKSRLLSTFKERAGNPDPSENPGTLESLFHALAYYAEDPCTDSISGVWFAYSRVAFFEVPGFDCADLVSILFGIEDQESARLESERAVGDYLAKGGIPL